ncbi:VCBS repeat-containing protein [bacterium]|nr:VCBS repeat-containing protein [bacterium]
MKCKIIAIAIFSLIVCSCTSEQDDDEIQTLSAVQTDWSGGPGVTGPVSEWSNRFAEASNISWSGEQESLSLSPGLATAHDVTTTFGEPAGVICADLDGDNDQDVVSVAFSGDEVAWFENDGNGEGWNKHIIASGFVGTVSLCAVNLDGDNDLDIVATAEEAHTVSWWANDGTGIGWTEVVIDDSAHGPFSVQAADFDGDGDQDLVSAINNDSQVVWYENLDGAGQHFEKHILPESAAGAWCAVARDMDNDQDADIVAVAFSANSVFWYENNGNGSSWTQQLIDNTFPKPVHVRAEDINGDQLIDVAAVSYSGDLAWWENNGSGEWLKHMVVTELDLPFSIRIEDLDGDDDRDLLANERNADKIWWYENAIGNGEFWIPHLIDETGDGPNDVSVGFVDNDDSLDVLASYSWDHAIRWYRLGENYLDTGELESSILDLGETAYTWKQIEWDCQTPPGTSIQIQVRASADSTNMNDWMIIANSGDLLSDYLAGSDRYFQYRLVLKSTDQTASPQFNTISIHWEQE